MRFADRNRVALGALFRYPLRTAMMLLATAIGVAAVVVLTSLGEGARLYVTGEFRSLGTHLLIVLPGRTETTGAGPAMLAGETPRDLTLGDARALERSAAIEMLAPVIVGKATASSGSLERDVSVMGTTAAFREIRNWKMASGEFLPAGDMEREAAVCVVGSIIGRELFRGEPPVGRWLRVNDRRCRISGVLAEQGTSVMVDADQLVLMPVALAQSLFNSPGLFRIIIQARGRDSMPAAKRFRPPDPEGSASGRRGRDRDHPGCRPADVRRHPRHAYPCAGWHCSHQPAGCRCVDHECHAGCGKSAHAGDRPTEGPGRTSQPDHRIVPG